MGTSESKEKLLDIEHDLAVTPTELEQKLKDLENRLISKISDKSSELLAANIKIDELNKQIEALKNMNDSLINKDKIIETNTNTNPDQKLKLSDISKPHIDVFVEKLLNDKNVNIKYLPAFVERQIYRNVINILLGLLDNLLSTANVQFIGHEIDFNLKSVPDNNNTNDTTNSNNN